MVDRGWSFILYSNAGSRAIQQRCPSCQQAVGIPEIRKIVAAMADVTRSIAEARKQQRVEAEPSSDLQSAPSRPTAKRGRPKGQAVLTTDSAQDPDANQDTGITRRKRRKRDSVVLQRKPKRGAARSNASTQAVGCKRGRMREHLQAAISMLDSVTDADEPPHAIIPVDSPALVRMNQASTAHTSNSA